MRDITADHQSQKRSILFPSPGKSQQSAFGSGKGKLLFKG
jgi:hypothetical protein